MLWLASSRWVAVTIVRSLEWRNLPPAELPEAQAIVVLGGITKPAEFPRSSIELDDSADRILRTAELFRAGKAPTVLVSAGPVEWSRPASGPEAPDIAALLERLGVPAQAIIEETHSRNTYENAVETRRIFEPSGTRRILLITSALHMPRAVALFRGQGFEVIPAPADFLVSKEDGMGFGDGSFRGVVLAILPDAQSLGYTTRALKEYLGLAIYRLRGLTD
jgi:uncharacterized SAM-binding protein YcdF (DUF218 family)